MRLKQSGNGWILTSDQRLITSDTGNLDAEEIMNMRIGILPKTSLGWWSVGFAIFFLLFLFAPIFSVQKLGSVTHQIGLSPGQIKGIIFLFTGIADFVTGLISIIRSKERSILVFITILIGLCAFLFVLGEVLFPH